MLRKRLFLAIPLPDEALALYARFQMSVNPLLQNEKKHRNFRWVPKENQHITVLFMGSVAHEDVAELSDSAGTFFNRHEPFRLEFENFTIMPARKKATMIWGRYKPSRPFTHIHFGLQQELSQWLKKEDKRQPVPHVTLARMKPAQLKGAIIEQMAETDASHKVEVQSVELWESHLKASGAEYEKLKSYQLG